jgi:hypothetical protein
MLHVLKTWPDYFDRIEDGTKTFEIRRNDRGFQTGDTLRLREYRPNGDHDWCDDDDCQTKRYTGREAYRRVGFVAAGDLFGLSLGEYVVLSLVRHDVTV